MDRRVGCPEVGMKIGMKLPADARAVYTAGRPSRVGGTEGRARLRRPGSYLMRQVRPCRPAPGHRPGPVQGGLRGLLTYAGSRGGMSPNSN